MPLLTPITFQQLPSGSNLLQSPFWGLFKSRFGWRPHAFLAGGIPLLLMEKDLPGGYTLLYTPHPFDTAGAEIRLRWDELCAELTDFFQGRRLCIRFDFPWEIGNDDAGEKLAEWDLHGLKRAVMDVQPPSTVVIPLEGTADDQLGAMKSKTRYNIRLSARKGVTTQLEDPCFVDTWYDLYCETAERDRISIHSKDYYRQLFTTAQDMRSGLLPGPGSGSDSIPGSESVPAQGPDTAPPALRIISARHEGELLAAVIISMYGGRATYMYGASSNQKRNLMASYAVQWAAIQMARDEGCTSYDLFGIPPADDPEHPMHGLYRFKTGFGGHILHRAGAWDLPLNRAVYALYRQVEHARYYYFKKLKKR